MSSNASYKKPKDCVTVHVDDVSAAVSFALFFSPLTKVKLINELNEREASLGVNENVSWHNVYKDSAWVFIGKTKKKYLIFTEIIVSFLPLTVACLKLH